MPFYILSEHLFYIHLYKMKKVFLTAVSAAALFVAQGAMAQTNLQIKFMMEKLRLVIEKIWLIHQLLSHMVEVLE